MNATVLKEKVDDAKRRLETAEHEMESALHHVEHAPREDKSFIGKALGTALAEMKAARGDLADLEQVIADGD
ncbi:MAG: hypothetical protein ACXWLM_02375 [Myxococcales bacterium]